MGPTVTHMPPNPFEQALNTAMHVHASASTAASFGMVAMPAIAASTEISAIPVPLPSIAPSAAIPVDVPVVATAAPSSAPSTAPFTAPFIAPPVTALDNPFTLNPRREDQLKYFLTKDKPCWNPALPPFRARQAAEDISHYFSDRKAYYNKPACMVCNVMHLFLPLTMRRSSLQQIGAHPSLARLTHMPVLNKLFQWHHSPGWKGMMALYPYTLLECTIYDFDFSDGGVQYIHPCASVVEAHRRVIELERVCFDLTNYLSKSIAKTQRLNVLPREHVKLAFAAISAGGGLFGSGADFWTPASPTLMDRLAKVLRNNDVASAITDDALWLQGNRAVAFTRHYTVVTELDWGMPLLALCFNNQEMLAHLDEEHNATALLSILEGEVRERVDLYIKDLTSLLVYGGRLTRYVRALYALCSEHHEIMAKMDKDRPPLPGNCKLLQLDSYGRLIGPDSRPRVAGHLELPPVSLADGWTRPPLPFQESCCDLLPDPTLPTLAQQRLAAEDARIATMLSTLFGSANEPNAVEPNAIAAFRRGHRNAVHRLEQDSHEGRLTAVLSPTASMPSAVYCPERLFGTRE